MSEVKCSVVAKIFKDQMCYDIIMCLGGDNGEYIATKTIWFQGIPHPQEAEAYGLKEAIIWLGNRGLPTVSIEFDSKQVADGISNKISTDSELGAILNYCKTLFSSLSNVMIILLCDKQTMWLIC